MDVQQVYEPRGAARKLFSTRDSEVLLDGPCGTGKSLAALHRLHSACLRYKKIRCLVVRKTATSLAETTLRTYEENVAEHFMAMGIVRHFGGSSRRPPAYQYRGGSEIVIGGMDKPEKILSSEYDLIFVDEATELTEDDWETLSTRLRHGKLPWQQQIATCNPSYPHHWLNKRSTITRLISRHEDNPRYVNVDGTYTPEGKAYIEGVLDKLSGVRLLRLRKGIWAAAEGLIYEDFDPAVHVVPSFPIPDDWPRYWSLDFGYTNPFVCQFWAQDGDGRLFLYREIYRTRRMVEDHCRDIAHMVMDGPQQSAEGLWRGMWTEPHPSAVLADHDAEGREVFTRHLGIPTMAADKKVSTGIQAVQSRLRLSGDRPRLYVFDNALSSSDDALRDAGRPVCTAEEFVSYIWDVKPGGAVQETPKKENDHGMDATRYLVAYTDLQPTGHGFRGFI